MNYIKEIRQALERVCVSTIALDMNTTPPIENYGLGDLQNDFKTLDQFITDYENLLKENEELKKAFEISCSFLEGYSSTENGELIKEDINDEYTIYPTKEMWIKSCINQAKLYKDLPNWEEILNKKHIETLHDSQAIEPSVLEKLDKLKENCDYINSALFERTNIIQDLQKQLAITDKAFDMCCDDMALSYNEEKEKYKKEYLEKAKEESEKENG